MPPNTYLTFSSLHATMKNEHQKQIVISATAVACIILFKTLLPWLMGLVAFPQSPVINKTFFLLFPHEIFGLLKYVLVAWAGSYRLGLIPLFSIPFAIFLLIAVAQFRNRQNKRPLAIACAILLLSMLISIPETIIYYINAVKAYDNYRPSTNKGILGLIDNFTTVQKPSLPFMIAQLAILLLYMGWAVWVLNRLYAARPNTSL